MTNDDLEDYLDLRQADLDPEWFAAALAVRHMRRLIVAGGNCGGHPEEEEALSPPRRGLSRSRGGDRPQERAL